MHERIKEHGILFSYKNSLEFKFIIVVQCDLLVNHFLVFQAWEAPWLRANRRDVRSTGCNRVPAFQIPTNNRRKQDVASLIEERLKQTDMDNKPVGQCEVPGVPVLNKQAPKGEADILKITPTVTWCGV